AAIQCAQPVHAQGGSWLVPGLRASSGPSRKDFASRGGQTEGKSKRALTLGRAAARSAVHRSALYATRNKEPVLMKRILSFSLFAALAFVGNAAFAEDTCTKIVATGHPQYPAIAYKDGDNIAGAAPMLVEAIAKNLKIPLESKYMGTWADAQAAARDGKADMIFGIYYNDERATYLDYVQPAFMFDEVVVFVAKGQ